MVAAGEQRRCAQYLGTRAPPHYGRWFIYYIAADKVHDDDEHRGVFVLEHTGSDPLVGSWTDRGCVNTRYTGIDGTTFAVRGVRYFVYSPYVGPDSVLAIRPHGESVNLGGEGAIIARPDRS